MYLGFKDGRSYGGSFREASSATRKQQFGTHIQFQQNVTEIEDVWGGAKEDDSKVTFSPEKSSVQ